MLVGLCGAGKSTLGNLLPHRTPDPDVGFKSEAGYEPVTTTCQTLQDDARGGSPFKVIETPGLPDPRGNTKFNFNRIVQEARVAGSLYAVVFVMNYAVNRDDCKPSIQKAVVLLEQLNKLGCTIIITCRVPGHVAGSNTEGIRSAEQIWTDFAREVADAGGIQYSAIYVCLG